MKRHLATPEEIAEYHRRQREGKIPPRFDGGRNSSKDAMSLDDVKKMIRGASKSGYKIPEKLLPKPPF